VTGTRIVHLFAVAVAAALSSSPAMSAEHSSFVGGPAEIAVIRRALPTEICAQAVPSYIFQSGRFAITEGSCGNPEMHGALVKKGSRWRLNPRCRFGGGVVPNDVLRTNLVACGFPVAVANKLVSLRRG
jgi:hypothetical protein